MAWAGARRLPVPQRLLLVPGDTSARKDREGGGVGQCVFMFSMP